jgi:hypothetical protein
MAITLTTVKNGSLSAHRPIKHVVSSNRYDSAATVFVAAISNTSGQILVTTTGNHGYTAGDIVTLAGMTNTAYNTKHLIDLIASPTTFRLTTTYTVVDTGTCTRTNNNFQIKADIWAYLATFNIVSVAAGTVGGNILVTTSAAHGLIAGDFVTIAGAASAAYGGSYKVQLVSASTTFEVVATYGATATGTLFTHELKASKYIKAVSSLFNCDISNILSKLLTENTLAVTAGATLSTSYPQSAMPYVIEYTEQFDNLAGLLANYGTNYSPLVCYAVNATLQFDETQSLAGFTAGATASKFLTNMPRTRTLQAGEILFLHILATGEPGHRLAYTLWTGPSGSGFIIAGVQSIGNYYIVKISASLFTGSVDKITMNLRDSGGTTVVSETFTFFLSNKCFENATDIYWKNRYGGIDNFRFMRIVNAETQGEKQYIKKALPETIAAGTREIDIIHSETRIIRELATASVSKDELLWLTELSLTRRAWIRSGSSLFAINIIDTSYVLINDDVYNFTMKYEYSQQQIIQ